MFLFTNSTTRAVAAAALLGTFVFAVPLTVGSTELAPALAGKSLPAHEILADASTSPATTAPAQMTAKNQRVELRIKELHNKLHITAAQQIPWDNMVEVMRDNAQAMIDLQKQRSEDAKSMTAVDAVKSYALVIKAHEAGMSKFVPVFQALYDSMSNSQKATADAMFQNRITTAAAK